MSIPILVVEDDFLNRRLIRQTLAACGYNVIDVKNAPEAMAALEKEEVSLLILDINLGTNQQDGISLGNYISEKYKLPFIYLTAYETTDIIQKAISTAPLSYLTKPFKSADLIASVEIALKNDKTKQQQSPYILAKDDEYNVKIPVDKIDYIECEGNYLFLHSNHKMYRCRSTIKQVLEKLPVSTFIQTHRAFIVNKEKIDMFSPKSLIVKGSAIPVSKSFIRNIQAVYELSDNTLSELNR